MGFVYYLGYVYIYFRKMYIQSFFFCFICHKLILVSTDVKQSHKLLLHVWSWPFLMKCSILVVPPHILHFFDCSDVCVIGHMDIVLAESQVSQKIICLVSPPHHFAITPIKFICSMQNSRYLQGNIKAWKILEWGSKNWSQCVHKLQSNSIKQ